MDENKSFDSQQIIPDDLTWRERDILNLLAERLTNREIAERLVLAESTVKDYVSRILGKLYVKNRRQAVSRAKELGLFDVPQPVATPVTVSLPAASTPFIGRRDEVETVKQHLRQTRLLTLSGPGGMGKTRLAMKAAEETADNFPDGTFFVSLAPIHSVDHIVQTIAEAVRFPIPTHENPKVQLLRYLQKKQLLLVMDNFEHLMDGVEIVSEILRSAPGIKVLSTSREKLNLQSETNLTIGGMSVGSQSKSKSPEKNDALALFVQSASKVRPGFDPTPGEMAKIAEICAFVEGMPLAIELAASWLHMLSVDEISDELQKGLDFLANEMRDAPERHRSIRAVFDQSWSLLDSNEQAIFMRLSVFRDGFTRQAAQPVAGASLRQVAGLVNKSILKLDPDSGRFEIHELLRQYAQEQLENMPQASDSTKEAYAAFFADFMQEKWGQIRGSDQMSALEEVEADIENVRAAWRYYLDRENAPQLLKFIHGFWITYWVRGWFRGAIELFEDSVDSLAQAGPDPGVQAVQAAAMAHLGFFMSWVGLPEKGYELGKESVVILERLESPTELAFAYQCLILGAYYLDRLAEEKEAVNHYRKIIESSGDPWVQAFGLWLANVVAFRTKNYAESQRLLEASLQLCSQINDSIVSALCFTFLAGHAIRNRDYAQAEQYFTRNFQISEELNFRWLNSNAIKYLGQIALLAGDINKARKHLTESLQAAYDLGLSRDIANHLYDFASLRVTQNKAEAGVALLALLLQQPAKDLVRAEGGRIGDNARELLAELENQLPPEAYQAAVTRGELLDLDAVVIDLIGLKK